MLQLRGCLYLGEKALGPECGGEIRMKNFDRDIAFVSQVMSEIDRGHAAGTHLVSEAVSGVQRIGKTGQNACHSGAA
jgi:hypothetical protein